MSDKELLGNIEPLSEEEIAQSEKSDFQEAANSIPTSLLSLHENMSTEDQKKLQYHLNNLKDQAIQYGNLNGDASARMACVKEIASIGKAILADFTKISYEDVLQYASSFITGIQNNEFLELVIREWLQLYIEAANSRKESEIIDKTNNSVLSGVSKVIRDGIRDPRSILKGLS